MNFPLTPKRPLVKKNDYIDSNRNLKFLLARELQDPVIRKKDMNCLNTKDKLPLKNRCSRRLKPKDKSQFSQKPKPHTSIEITSNLEEISESNQIVFLEEFPLMKQEPVQSCGTCGEIFLVESGLTQHRLRYHSETSVKDIH